MAANFMDGTTLGTRLALRDKIIASLEHIGVSSDHRADVEAMWRRGIGIIYHRGIRHLLLGGELGRPRENATKEQREVAKEFLELMDFESWTAPTPQQTRQFFARHSGYQTKEIDTLIDDYESYVQTGELRRREVFVKL
jgi:hypothetical protein